MSTTNNPNTNNNDATINETMATTTNHNHNLNNDNKDNLDFAAKHLALERATFALEQAQAKHQLQMERDRLEIQMARKQLELDQCHVDSLGAYHNPAPHVTNPRPRSHTITIPTTTMTLSITHLSNWAKLPNSRVNWRVGLGGIIPCLTQSPPQPITHHNSPALAPSRYLYSIPAPAMHCQQAHMVTAVKLAGVMALVGGNLNSNPFLPHNPNPSQPSPHQHHTSHTPTQHHPRYQW